MSEYTELADIANDEISLEFEGELPPIPKIDEVSIYDEIDEGLEAMQDQLDRLRSQLGRLRGE